MGSVLGSFGAFQGNIWSVAPFIPVGNLQKTQKKLFLTRIPTKYLKSYIFWTGSSRRFRKGRTLEWDSQLHLGCLQHHCDLAGPQVKIKVQWWLVSDQMLVSASKNDQMLKGQPSDHPPGHCWPAQKVSRSETSLSFDDVTFLFFSDLRSCCWRGTFWPRWQIEESSVKLNPSESRFLSAWARLLLWRK